MWLYKRKKIKSISDMPAGVVGFIYEITDSNGKKYIGRKSVVSITKVRISKKKYDTVKAEGGKVLKSKDKAASVKAGSPVWIYKQRVIKETNWLDYTGSCDELNKAIAGGMGFEKRILHFCYSRKQMTYYELKHMFLCGVLESDKYYNKNISGKFFPEDLLIQKDLFFETDDV